MLSEEPVSIYADYCKDLDARPSSQLAMDNVGYEGWAARSPPSTNEHLGAILRQVQMAA
jgi:hypothetical protein